MQGKVIVTGVAIAGWFVAALVAFVIVALFDFLGVGFIGVLIAFVATQGELHSGTSTGGTFGAAVIRHQAGGRQSSPERQAAERAEQSLIARSGRFFRHFGVALAVIGFWWVRLPLSLSVLQDRDQGVLVYKVLMIGATFIVVQAAGMPIA